MAYRTSLLPPVQGPADAANSLANIGFTLTNPQVWANADLMKARTASELADIEYKKGKLALDQQTTAAQLPVYASEVTKNTASAEASRAQSVDYARAAALKLQQYDARKNAAPLFQAAGASPADAALGANFMQASGPATGAEDYSKMVTTFLRPDPAKGSPGDVLYWSQGGMRDPRAPNFAPSTAAPQAPAISAPAAQIPFSQGGMQLPPQAAGPASVPSAPGTYAPPFSQRQPAQVGNMSIVPGRPASAGGSSLEEFQKQASASINAAKQAQRLNNPEALANARNPFSGVSFRIPFLMQSPADLGDMYDWNQRGSSDPKSVAAYTDRMALNNVMTTDWLDKSIAMKGPLSDKDREALQKNQPKDNASAESKSQWLDSVAYFAKLNAKWNSDNAQALQAGVPQPDPVAWRQQYEASNPPPKLGYEKLKEAQAAKKAAKGDPQANSSPAPQQPATMRQAVQGAVQPAAAAPVSDDRVTVVSPDGQIGHIPKSQLSDALKQGYREQYSNGF